MIHIRTGVIYLQLFNLETKKRKICKCFLTKHIKDPQRYQLFSVFASIRSSQ